MEISILKTPDIIDNQNTIDNINTIENLDTMENQNTIEETNLIKHTKNKIECQNFAFCRYLQIWCLFYFIGFVKSTPLISLIIVSFIHLLNLKLSSKRIGILLQDYSLISLVIYNNIELYIYENLLVVLIYIKILRFANIHPIKLYTIYLPEDDNKYIDENYCQYSFRIWKMFLF